MPRRAKAIVSRVVFLLCGLVSLVTAAPYAMLRGVDLPYQREWIIFVVALALVGGCSITLALLPASWLAKACRKDSNDTRLFSTPLKWVGVFAAIAYVLAIGAYFVPHSWNLDPQFMLSLCPMYLIRMTFDPSAFPIFFLLAPMNAAVYGALGLMVGYARLALRKNHER
jgi:hypothetical protein